MHEQYVGIDFVATAKLAAGLCGGLFAGAAVYISLVEHPARMACGTELAATEFGPSYRRAAVMQATLAIVGTVAAIFAWLAGEGTMWLVGGALLGAVVPFTLLAILPTNKRLLDLARDRSSDETRLLLVRWGRLHEVRSVLSSAAVLIFLWALTAG